MENKPRCYEHCTFYKKGNKCAYNTEMDTNALLEKTVIGDSCIHPEIFDSAQNLSRAIKLTDVQKADKLYRDSTKGPRGHRRRNL